MSGGITQDAIKSNLVAVLIEVCKLPREKIEYDIPVSELGVDSVEVAGLFSALEERLQQETGVKVDIDPTLAWDYPTINKMAAHLAQVVST